MAWTDQPSCQGLTLNNLWRVADRSGHIHSRTVTASSRRLRGRHSVFDIPTTLAPVDPVGPGSSIQPPPIPSRVHMPHDPYTPLLYQGRCIDAQGDDLEDVSEHVGGEGEEDVDMGDDVLSPTSMRVGVLRRRRRRRMMTILGYREDQLLEVHRIQRSCHHMVDMLSLPFVLDLIALVNWDLGISLTGTGDSQHRISMASISAASDDPDLPMDIRASRYMLSMIGKSIFTDKSGLNNFGHASCADTRDLGGCYSLLEAWIYLYVPMFASPVTASAVARNLYIEQFELLRTTCGGSVLEYRLRLDIMTVVEPHMPKRCISSVDCRAFPLLVLTHHVSIVDWIARRLGIWLSTYLTHGNSTRPGLAQTTTYELGPLQRPLPRPLGPCGGLLLPWELVPNPDLEPDLDPDSLDFFILVWGICMCSHYDLSLLVEPVLRLPLVNTVGGAPETEPYGFNGITGCRYFGQLDATP
ncbi:hypothetical protein M9H77_26791 [Catharanthus roseus]|uniref:Uncharacterized protein n=1 Tax=Catharanthus roseus TaxID=4058 RepID=A0ACC0AEY2_CATRO|nr:hypothetical protein M9H77_26791 [Catharanthus roseus]